MPKLTDRQKEETPPRAWGRQLKTGALPADGGNTPTSVGKTSCGGNKATTAWKHPHERGEDPLKRRGIRGSLETPPRAWGRRPQHRDMDRRPGNTPTSVGKTWPACGASRWSKKHPHERGEDTDAPVEDNGVTETPPRAWGRLSRLLMWRSVMGNTPTSVGKTESRRNQINIGRKHPHERGEDREGLGGLTCKRETPPRAWGRLKSEDESWKIDRNTPTSVGKTPVVCCRTAQGQKHPHERGEDGIGQKTTGHDSETPPRAWGRLLDPGGHAARRGNTPTSVGKTAGHRACPGTARKHPHERGEDKRTRSTRSKRLETPPRAWGRRWHG